MHTVRQLYILVVVIGLLAPYLYRYWHDHASRLLLVTEIKKVINIAQTTPDRKKEQNNGPSYLLVVNLYPSQLCMAPCTFDLLQSDLSTQNLK